MDRAETDWRRYVCKPYTEWPEAALERFIREDLGLVQEDESEGPNGSGGRVS